MSKLRSRYLDLMVKVVTNTIYEDPDNAPWSNRSYSADERASGKDWPLQAHSMVGTLRMNNLRDLCESVLQSNIEGDFIETGVWRGGACILMRSVLSAYEDTNRLVYCCDSFEGLPKPDVETYPVDKDDPHHTFDQLAVSLEQVKSNFAKYDFLDDRTVFVKGFFKDTLHKIPAEKFSLVRLDGDMYESTIQALDTLYPRLAPGGFIIIDDYGAVPACKIAVLDYRRDHNIDAPMHEADWTGIWWQKPVSD